MATWTDEQKQDIIAKYKAMEPTPANSMECVKQIADDLDASPNAIRMILTTSGEYIKKDAAAKSTSTSTSTSGDKAPRVSKEAAHNALIEAIQAANAEVDSEIVSKLTGKAAQYFTGVLKAAAGESED